MPSDQEIRETILATVARSISPADPEPNLQTGPLLSELSQVFDARRNPALGRAVLTQLHDLFRTGHFAWGINLGNPNPPFFHVTERGARVLARMSRDPGNPAGYLAHLEANVALNLVAKSYLVEGLNCFVTENFKACAVMVGAAAESLALELRDLVVEKVTAAGQTPPKDLVDWKISQVLSGLAGYFQRAGKAMPKELHDRVDAYWPAAFQFIRSARNEAGHPSSIEPITEDVTHAALLMFPELGRLAQDLRAWLATA